MKKWEHLVFKQCEFQSTQNKFNSTDDHFPVTVRSLATGKKNCTASMRAYAGLYFHYFKLAVNEHVNITTFSWVFSMNFPGLEITILIFHDFSRFSMTVGTLGMSIMLITPSARLRKGWTCLCSALQNHFPRTSSSNRRPSVQQGDSGSDTSMTSGISFNVIISFHISSSLMLPF